MCAESEHGWGSSAAVGEFNGLVWFRRTDVQETDGWIDRWDRWNEGIYCGRTWVLSIVVVIDWFELPRLHITTMRWSRSTNPFLNQGLLL